MIKCKLKRLQKNEEKRFLIIVLKRASVEWQIII